MLAVAAVAVGLAGVFYRRVLGQVMPSRWRLLLALRVVAILLVVLLLFRPILSLERDEQRAQELVLLLDSSASMSTADDATGATRFEQARARVLDWSARLKRDFALHVLEFSDRAATLDRPGALAQVKPTGEFDLPDPRLDRCRPGGPSAGRRGRRALLGRDSQCGR